MRRTILVPTLAVLLVSACQDADVNASAAAEASEASVDARVWFVTPQDGDEIRGTVRVELGNEGVEVVPAGVPGQGKGHHHLFVNEDVTPLDAVIPANNPGIIHLGQGQGEHLLEGLEPGDYRLIAVLADGIHVPVDPPLADTIHIRVLPAEDTP